MMRMNNLSKVYRTHMIETHALRGFDIHVKEGEFVAVTGPSGSGKTTFLNIAGLLEELTGGEYKLDGVDVKQLDDRARSRLRNEKIGFIFQSFNLIPDLDIYDNVDVPLRYRRLAARDRDQRIKSALDNVTANVMIADRDLNLRLGTTYLKLVLDDFGGSQALAAAAYNAGPGRPRRWREGPPIEPAAWAESIPFNETRDYVKKVLSNATLYAALLKTAAPSLKARLGPTIAPRTPDAAAENKELP